MAKALYVMFSILFTCFLRAQQSSPPPTSHQAEPPTLKVDTLDQQLFFCTTRIEARSADGKQTSTGTGFIFSYRADEWSRVPFRTPEILFIVTCRHVVNGFASATFSFVESKDNRPNLGRKCEAIVSNLQSVVFYDPDPKIDVALIPLVPILNYLRENGQTPFFRSLNTDLVPSQKDAEDLNTIQSIVFIGYPYGVHDEINLLPLARRGYTASPYVVDFSGSPLFLIDASVFPGSSGSPVMVLDQGSYSSGNNIIAGNRTYFLGLVSDAYIRREEGLVQFKQVPTQFVPYINNTNFFNLGVVIKAKAILHTMSEYVKNYPRSN